MNGTWLKAAGNTMIGLGLIGALLITVPALSSEPNPEYAPERFGVRLGMPEQELLQSLVRQGFSFKPGGEFEHIRGSRDLDMLFDLLLVVAPENGSTEIWQSGNVILGVKDGFLTVVGEINAFDAKEANQVFDELSRDFDAAFGERLGGHISTTYWSRNQREFLADWESLQWFAPKGEVSKNSRNRQNAWRAGTRLTSLSIRRTLPREVAKKLVKKKQRLILLLHAQWCAYPLLDRIWKNTDFPCSEDSGRAQAAAASTAIEAPQGRIWVDVTLDRQGRIVESEVVTEVPAEAAETVRDWLGGLGFEPAMVGGQPVPSTSSLWVKLVAQTSTAGAELKIAEFDAGSRPVEIVAPDYPREAARTGTEGWVKISFTIDAAGRVTEARVTESSDPVFEESALQAIQQWRFKPRTADGRAIPATMVQTIDYNLE